MTAPPIDDDTPARLPTDPYDLARFLEAQNGIFSAIAAELDRGRKTSHWIWFAFPQIEGLGTSTMSRRYAIASPDEARAYLGHPVLGARLRELTEIAMSHKTSSALDIFGPIDALKFRSCLTLFAAVSEPDSIFGHALDQFFAGQGDERTLEWLRR